MLYLKVRYFIFTSYDRRDIDLIAAVAQEAAHNYEVNFPELHLTLNLNSGGDTRSNKLSFSISSESTRKKYYYQFSIASPHAGRSADSPEISAALRKIFVDDLFKEIKYGCKEVARQYYTRNRWQTRKYGKRLKLEYAQKQAALKAIQEGNLEPSLWSPS